MIVSNEMKLQKVNSIVDEISKLEYRFNELLAGFKLYNEHKGTFDIDLYEKSLTLFNGAIAALEEQMINFHNLLRELKGTIQ
jgi:hypothetical protein